MECCNGSPPACPRDSVTVVPFGLSASRSPGKATGYGQGSDVGGAAGHRWS